MKMAIYKTNNHYIHSLKPKNEKQVFVNYYCEKERVRIVYSEESDKKAYESRKVEATGLFLPLTIEKAYGLLDFVEVAINKDVVIILAQVKVESIKSLIPISFNKAEPLPAAKLESEVGIKKRSQVTIPSYCKIVGTRKISVKYGMSGNYILVRSGMTPISSEALCEKYGKDFHYLQENDFIYQESEVSTEANYKIPDNFKIALNLNVGDNLRLLSGTGWFALVPKDKTCEITDRTVDMSVDGIQSIKLCENCLEQIHDLKETVSVGYKINNKKKQFEATTNKIAKTKEKINGQICETR